MTKVMLHLSIDPSLMELAKASGMNLSKEFEEWIKIRLGNINEDKPIVNIDLEIAKYRAEIQKLQNQAELAKEQEYKEQEEIMVIDGIIDNELTLKKPEQKIEDLVLSDIRIHGAQFLFKQKFNKMLNPLEAKELLEKRMKERKLID